MPTLLSRCCSRQIFGFRPIKVGSKRWFHLNHVQHASSADSVPSFRVFDRNVKRLQRSRAAWKASKEREMDYLRSEIANRLTERLLLINRKFDNVLDLGAGACHIAQSILLRESVNLEVAREEGQQGEEREGEEKIRLAPKSQISRLVCVELSEEMLYRDHPLPESRNEENRKLKVELVHADEEHVLLKPLAEGGLFADNTFDAVVSGGSMHWINDLPAVLRNVNRVLKPDGPLLAAMFGGDSLHELRSSLQLADVERLGGVTPHVSPLADVRDIGGLLQQASFKLLTIDVEEIVVEYPDVFALMKDLGDMGEGNAVLARRMSGLGKEVLYALDSIYREMYGSWGGSLPASFRIINFIGWKESDTQRKPLERGSAQLSLKDALKT